MAEWEITTYPPEDQYVIDNHSHLLSDELLPKEVFETGTVSEYEKQRIEGKEPDRSLLDSAPDTSHLDPTGESHIEEMDEAGIDETIIFPVDFGYAEGMTEPSKSIREINQHYMDVIQKYPDRFEGYATVDPQREDATDIIKDALDTGVFSGIKLHPTTGFYLHDDDAYDILNIAVEYDVTVLTDAKPIRAPLKSKYIHPIHLDEVVSDFPDVTLIAAHAGMDWWEDLLAIARVNLNTGLHVDISSWQERAKENPEHFATVLRSFIDNIGAGTQERLAWIHLVITGDRTRRDDVHP
jgi:predicted TIM-barrel fold metal-dependent hydrolase